MLHALIFLSVSSPVPISAAAQFADGYIASLPHFSSSLTSVDVFLHTPPSPLMSLRSDFSRSRCWCSGLPAASASCGHPQGPVGKSVSQGGNQLSRLHCLYPKQMGKAQDEDFSRGEMVPSQRVQERDAASWEKRGGKAEPLVCLIVSENWNLQKAEFCIAIANQTSQVSLVYLSKIIKTT